MNEAEMLIHLLTRSKTNKAIGSTEEEMLKYLGYQDMNARHKLQNMLSEISETLYPLGLEIRLNPINKRWFIAFRNTLGDFQVNTQNLSLSPGLAATLFSILILSLKEEHAVPINKIKELRKRKTISDHINDLEKMGFLTQKGGRVALTPKIFYYIDINKLDKELESFEGDDITNSAVNNRLAITDENENNH